MRVAYRIRQFWLALTAGPGEQDLAAAREVLTPAQMALFQRMQASEQAHSLWVFCQLRQSMIDQNLALQQDLLVAALLHDVGKSCYPLRLWERVLIVLGKALFPQYVKRWGCQPPDGWRRAFVIAEQHPAWGAELAAQAGASALAVALVRRHQDILKRPSQAISGAADRQDELLLEDRLLLQLQHFDEER